MSAAVRLITPLMSHRPASATPTANAKSGAAGRRPRGLPRPHDLESRSENEGVALAKLRAGDELVPEAAGTAHSGGELRKS